MHNLIKIYINEKKFYLKIEFLKLTNIKINKKFIF